MNVKRFAARTSREALQLVRQALGEDAIVLSTRPAAEGVEVLAMAPDGVQQIERLAATAPRTVAAAPRRGAGTSALAARAENARGEAPRNEVADDAEQLAMSTLSFQDYVRERMLKRRQAALSPSAGALARDPGYELPPPAVDDRGAAPITVPGARDSFAARVAGRIEPRLAPPRVPELGDDDFEPPAPVAPRAARAERAERFAPEAPLPAPMHAPAYDNGGSGRRAQAEMMNELRSMKGLIEERFGTLAFMEKLQRQPRHAQLAQKLLDCGFSPALIRKLLDGLDPSVADEATWAATVLERNLATGEAEPPLEEMGGVYALIGSTGVGKTTSTAKIAAAFAARHGASQLGLITLDAYRMGAHEQLRAYGRILGVPVHIAHDRASLEDLLDLLAGKKMVLIDTAGMAQRDSRTRELLEMLSHRSVQKLLVLDASQQGETLDDVVISWRAAQCRGIVLSKIDEAVKLAPALDTLIRHRLKVMGVANGQRVPEDWHRLSAHALVQRALRGGGTAAFRLEPSEVHLVFAGAAAAAAAAAGAAAHRGAPLGA